MKQYEKLLVGGIWCIVSLSYFYEENQKGSPFSVTDLKPIQMPNMDMEQLFEGRRAFTEDQWLDVLIRSTGMEPTVLEKRVKWHLLARMIPLVENNYNFCELGPRGTGKSHIYKEISPNSMSGFRRPDHGGQPVLQHGQPQGGLGRVCGMWWPLMRWRASPSRITMAFRS